MAFISLLVRTTLVGGADPLLVNSGQLAEQFIGQELRARNAPSCSASDR
jgi:hypothetical protein